MEDSTHFENEHICFEFKNDILYGCYKASYVDLELAKQIVRWRLEFTNFQPVKLLVTQKGLKVIKREARMYLNSDEGAQLVIAAALIARNAFEKHLANFFQQITFANPKVPMRIFSNEDEALKWLNKH
ncbi:MAG: hypothetical protein R2780_07060 [Crocinitomicaceae bacterium]|nr:hypothetical protein [Crocinitomicaceae bacterium]